MRSRDLALAAAAFGVAAITLVTLRLSITPSGVTGATNASAAPRDFTYCEAEIGYLPAGDATVYVSPLIPKGNDPPRDVAWGKFLGRQYHLKDGFAATCSSRKLTQAEAEESLDSWLQAWEKAGGHIVRVEWNYRDD